MKIYVVDMQRVFAECKVYTEGVKMINDREAEMKNTLVEMKNQLSEKINITKSALVLSPGEKESAMVTAREIQQNMMKADRDFSLELQDMNSALLERVEQSVTPVLDVVCSKLDADVVLPVNAVIFAGHAADITAEVVAAITEAGI